MIKKLNTKNQRSVVIDEDAYLKESHIDRLQVDKRPTHMPNECHLPMPANNYCDIQVSDF